MNVLCQSYYSSGLFYRYYQVALSFICTSGSIHTSYRAFCLHFRIRSYVISSILSALQDSYIRLIEHFICTSGSIHKSYWKLYHFCFTVFTSSFIQIPAQISTCSISCYRLCIASCRKTMSLPDSSFIKSNRPDRYVINRGMPARKRSLFSANMTPW